jgi:hypothetical protein
VEAAVDLFVAGGIHRLWKIGRSRHFPKHDLVIQAVEGLLHGGDFQDAAALRIGRYWRLRCVRARRAGKR